MEGHSQGKDGLRRRLAAFGHANVLVHADLVNFHMNNSDYDGPWESSRILSLDP